MFTALILTSILALTSAPQGTAGQASTSQSCREAYVEGWFQETAEADLEAALRSYRTCTAIGTSADRELVARALWRMGMIARAREESDVAEQLFERVLAEFEGTRAAKRAREALAAPAPIGEAESEAVAEARDVLRKMLLDPESRSSTLMRVVLHSLSAEQIAEECSQFDAEMGSILEGVGQYVGAENTGKLAELALLSNRRTARAAILSLERFNLDSLPEEALALASGPPREIDERLFSLLSPQHGDEAMAALEKVAERSPELLEWKKAAWHAFGDLMANPHPVAGQIVQRMVSSVPRTPKVVELLSRQIQQTDRWIGDRRCIALHEATPGGNQLRAFFPTLPPSIRETLAQWMVDLETQNVVAAPRVAVDLLLNDLEPAVRRFGLLLLVQGSDPAWRTEALGLMRGESVDDQLTVLEAACRATDPAYELDELLDVAPGPAREYVYLLTLSFGSGFRAEGRRVVDILRAGLDRGDPELLTAVFAPTDALRQLRQVAINLGPIAEALRQDAPAVQEENLAKRLILAALASPAEPVRVTAPALASEALGPDEFTACIEIALVDPSPRVRSNALKTKPEGVRTELLASLLADPDQSIFVVALPEVYNRPEALLAAVESLSPDRRLRVLLVAKQYNHVEVVRALYELDLAGSSSRLASKAFDFLKTRDAEILISALTHSSPYIHEHAARQLGLLELPGFSLGPLVAGPPSVNLEARVEEQERLREMEAEVVRALRLWNVRQLAQNLDSPSAQIELARVLVDLGDRPLILEYAMSVQRAEYEVGGRGLVLLGDRETMREALGQSVNPERLLPFAMQLDLVEECVELYRSGRIRSWRLVEALETEHRYEELARLLFGEPAPLLTIAIQPQLLALCVDAAAALGDPLLLSRAAERHFSGAAVGALFELGALDRVLTDLPRWKGDAEKRALAEISRRLDEPAEWSEYVTEQEEHLAEWRAKLGVSGDDR